jgi:hypothetical protein
MNPPPKILDADERHFSVTYRKLGKIWQFSLGSTWFVLGSYLVRTWFVGNSRFFVPKLLPSNPFCRGIVPSFRCSRRGFNPSTRKRRIFASFSLKASGEYINARIDNYNYLSNCEGLQRLLQLNSGEKIIAWFKRKDIAEANNAVVWRIQYGGEDLLTLEQTSQAHKDQVRRFLCFMLAILGIGATLMFWGWRIWLSEQKNAQSSQKSVSSSALN